MKRLLLPALAPPRFEPVQPELLGLGGSFVNAWADADGDDDLDLFVGFNGTPNRLYRNDAEWPWEYIFIIITHGFFALDRVGQVLGLDALVRRARPGVLTSPSLLGRAYRLAS